ncbi:1,4-alpha-glucan branching protein domain-containing protein [Patulibacter minatonensis]|uniref:1,4-alpha-glucan branching protein domain-containing protein n=1 Tax=Patulibacter minatonensis TaxID=298163 RepID=UPI00047C5393|nr:1,4-alpha-glucan branching protein domain-containing protein [Patulibacter minatonensis]
MSSAGPGDGGGPGALAIVLHTHLPYVEGFDTWPFGEEWLWEAAATCYLPLGELLDRHAGARALTVSVTPVLADQLLAPGVVDRFRTFLDDTREDVYGREIDGFLAGGHEDEARSLRALREHYRTARRRTADAAEVAGTLLRHASWTSSATHAVLPLLASPGGVATQLRAGIDAHRRRRGPWAGGLWLPECAYDPRLDGALVDHGVRTTCVDLTDPLGHGSPAHLTPYATAAGTMLLPIDRALMDLVWSDGAMPAAAPYRDTHRRTTFHLQPWSNDGHAWDPARAGRRARVDAATFVDAAIARVADGGLATVALDTEFLGHWWIEGVGWLEAVLDEAAARGLRIVHADDAAAAARRAGPPPLPAPARRTTTWGTPRDLSTWSGPGVAELAWEARRLELDVLAAGPRATPRAWRELLALQSSDWAFLRTRGTAGDYPERRFAGHAEALRLELAAPGTLDAGLRGLAPHLEPPDPATRDPQLSPAAR